MPISGNNWVATAHQIAPICSNLQLMSLLSPDQRYEYLVVVVAVVVVTAIVPLLLPLGEKLPASTVDIIT